MINLTIAWLVLPFIASFLVYLFSRFYRVMALMVSFASMAYSAEIFSLSSPWHFILLDHFGVSLTIDEMSAFFILTNAMVTLAVTIYCWESIKSIFFFTQIMMLHGSINAIFICSDFISVYVALEVIGIAAFLLIVHPRSDRSIWVGLRYLFVSNVAMLFYLVGAVLVYQANHSFAFSGLNNAPPEAKVLIFLGLLVKGGIFISGLWLPFTHSEAQVPVSAMLSGVVVKAGVFPILRCALLIEDIDPVVRLFGVASALFGALFAVLEKDSKRLLAFSTISQLGFIVSAPIVGGFYALTHGLVKSALFLTAGTLPSRDFDFLRKNPINPWLWGVLALASLSISGFPLLSGFPAKVLTGKHLLPWQTVGMNLAAVGTAISFAKFIFLPCAFSSKSAHRIETKISGTGYWLAMLVLLAGLAGANFFYIEAYTLENSVKPILTILAGWLLYWLIFKRFTARIPRAMEEFEHQIGIMSLMLVFLFWVVWL